jgi:hypothetical protein
LNPEAIFTVAPAIRLSGSKIAAPPKNLSSCRIVSCRVEASTGGSFTGATGNVRRARALQKPAVSRTRTSSLSVAGGSSSFRSTHTDRSAVW